MSDTFENFDKEHIWMFDSGFSGMKEFQGNPKYLFCYINKYRPDIYAYWYCVPEAKETIEKIRKLGFRCVVGGTPEAEKLLCKTGVLVTENLREFMPSGLRDFKIINLWHGCGFKRVENNLVNTDASLNFHMARKNILYGSLFHENQLLCVTSPIYEKEFAEDFGLSEEHFLRTGYLRCMYNKKYPRIETFDHDILKQKKLSEKTKIAVYAPTYRDIEAGNFFQNAFENLDRLYACCEKNDILLIFKAHPHLEEEITFQNAKNTYGDKKYFYFWNNQDDFYEIIDRIDLAIYDYSSIFSDLLCTGVKNFIRYIFDEQEYMESGLSHGAEVYYERTCGKTCHSFDELINAIENFENEDNSEEVKKVYDKLWSYAGDDDFEKTIQAVFDFKLSDKKLPTLYSFDVFDTLVGRKGLAPFSVFHGVQDRMKESGRYDEDLTDRYPGIRHSAEMNVREYYDKTVLQRNNNKNEICFDEIFSRLSDVYGLTSEQIEELKAWEIEEEISAVVPLEKNISYIKELLDKGETVVLISDMYLPREVLKKILSKADPILGELPLFLSNESGYRKQTGYLYLEVFKSFKPYYNFKKWIHYGDNEKSDKSAARRYGISSVLVPRIEFSQTQKALVERFYSKDSHLYAGLCAYIQQKYSSIYKEAEFCIDIVASTLLPYVYLVLKDAVKRGFEKLYFVTRDGYFLKIIADEIIKTEGLNIETELIYVSRRTWRVQSYIDKIDDTFFSKEGGNFCDVRSKEKFLEAACIDEEKFYEIFPHIDLDSIDWTDGKNALDLANNMKASDKYNDYLLEYSRNLREISQDYITQTIDANQKFAIVEYWGRGYTQECFTRLWNDVHKRDDKTYFYYARSIYPSDENNIRFNITDINIPLEMMEPIFSGIHFKSISEYTREDGVVKPVIEPNANYCKSLCKALEEMLPVIAEAYCKSDIKNPEQFSRKLFDFIIGYTYDNMDSPLIADNFGQMNFALSVFGKKREYAPAYTRIDIENFKNKQFRSKGTTSVVMSYSRMFEADKKIYDELFQVKDKKDIEKRPLLTDNDIAANRRFAKQYDQYYRRAEMARNFYEKAAATWEVENKVIILSTTKECKSDTLWKIQREFEKRSDIKTEWIHVYGDDISDRQLMEKIAVSRYIIEDGNIPQTLKVNYRTESRCIKLLSKPFRIYNFGNVQKFRLDEQALFNRFLHKGNPDAVEVVSRDNSEHSGFDYSIGGMLRYDGATVTDVYFDESFKAQAKKELEEIFPESKGKKVIFYFALTRKSFKVQKRLELLDIEVLQKLKDKYCLVIDIPKEGNLVNECCNTIEIEGFSKDVTNKVSLRKLLAAADVIIGDYRDMFFESVLLDKPVFGTFSDIDSVMNGSVNMMHDLRRINPFPVVNSAEELISALENIEEYDYTPLKKFRDEYFEGCDGGAASRIINSMTFDEDEISFKDKTLIIKAGEKVVPEILGAGRSGDILWISDNEEVAQVDPKGRIVGFSHGVSKITAHIGDKKASCLVRVLFDDVKADDELFDTLVWCDDLGMSFEEKRNIFYADKQCSKADIVYLLWVMIGRPDVGSNLRRYNIRNYQGEHEDALEWAMSRGIFTPNEASCLCEEDKCTKAEAGRILWTHGGKPENSTGYPAGDEIITRKEALKALHNHYRNMYESSF